MKSCSLVFLLPSLIFCQTKENIGILDFKSIKVSTADVKITLLDRDKTSIGITGETFPPSREGTLAIYSLERKPLPDNTLSGVIVYPNPYKPGSGGDYDDAAGGGIVFGHLTENVKIKIFNIAEELVKEINHSGGDSESWLEAKSLASGVYIYVVTSNSQKKVGRFTIIK